MDVVVSRHCTFYYITDASCPTADGAGCLCERTVHDLVALLRPGKSQLDALGAPELKNGEQVRMVWSVPLSAKE